MATPTTNSVSAVRGSQYADADDCQLTTANFGLVSWNFRHIVRLDKIRLFNAVNIEQGYKPISIYSPREVINYGQED